MAAPSSASSPLAGVVPGSVVVAVVLLALRLAGLAPLPAYAAAVLAGILAALLVSGWRARERADLGLTATLTLTYSLLTGVRPIVKSTLGPGTTTST